MAGHSIRAHSPIGPSSMERHLGCPASRRESRGEKNSDTFFTRQGTAGHEFVEFVVNSGFDDDELEQWMEGVIDLGAKTATSKFIPPDVAVALGYECDEWTTFPIDEDQIEGVTVYRDTLVGLIEPGDEWALETRLDMPYIHPELFGTSDAYVYKKRKRHLAIIDYKYGRGYAVEVYDNPQLMTYAVGVYRKLLALGYKIDTIELIVVQPRAYHRDGPVRPYPFKPKILEEFEFRLVEGLRKTEDPNAQAAPGSHCRWCPAAYRCEALRDFVLYEVLNSTIDPDGEPYETDLPKISRLTPEQLGRVVKAAKIIEGWLRSVFHHAYAEAVEGRIAPGTKLVDKRAYRKFLDKTKVIRQLSTMGFGDDDYMTEPELLPLTQIEKLVGKKTFETKFRKLWAKRSTGYVLTTEDDARPAVNPDHSAGFGAAVED